MFSGRTARQTCLSAVFASSNMTGTEITFYCDKILNARVVNVLNKDHLIQVTRNTVSINAMPPQSHVIFEALDALQAHGLIRDVFVQEIKSTYPSVLEGSRTWSDLKHSHYFFSPRTLDAEVEALELTLASPMKR